MRELEAAELSTAMLAFPQVTTPHLTVRVF